jgi:hypothetical protein
MLPPSLIDMDIEDLKALCLDHLVSSVQPIERNKQQYPLINMDIEDFKALCLDHLVSSQHIEKLNSSTGTD